MLNFGTVHVTLCTKWVIDRMYRLTRLHIFSVSDLFITNEEIFSVHFENIRNIQKFTLLQARNE